jgi:PBSX family phage terminase large subunit
LTADIEIDESIFLPCYQHILEDNDIDIEFIWGGRDSGKSHFVAQKLILDCLNLDYFRCIMIKKTYESIKDSQWQTIKDIVNEWNLDAYFTFLSSPLEIKCYNGNKFIARGCDNPTKLKSIRNPSHAWYEEGDQITLEDFTTISTTLRTNTGKVKQYFVFNPELPKGIIDKKDFWLYKNYFSFTNEKNFTHEIKYKLSEKIEATIKYRSTHTTYKDNLEYVTEDRIVTHENLKVTNPGKYLPYTLGEWGTYSNEMPFFYSYSHSKHYSFGKYELSKDYTLDIGFDFNIAPCCAVIGQHNRHKLTWNVFDVIIADPTNKYHLSPLAAVCAEIREKYIDTGLISAYRIRVTGDASGKHGSADRQEAQTFYHTIMRSLKLNESQLEIRNANVTHVMSGDMINEVLYKLPQGHLNLIDVPELEKDIRKAYPDKDKSLNDAKKKFGLHILDAWRYLMDMWFGYVNGYYVDNIEEIQNNIISINRRIESLKKVA